MASFFFSNINTVLMFLEEIPSHPFVGLIRSWMSTLPLDLVMDALIKKSLRSLCVTITCLEEIPSSTLTSPAESRGFLIVHTNGGLKLNQMHAGVIRATKSDSRLVNNNLPTDIQKLCCRACYEALRFAPHIEAMGKLLVDRMRSLGPYIALHLRYEKHMLAFSGCDLSPDEADELRKIRYKFKQPRLNFVFFSSMMSTHPQYKLKVSGAATAAR